MSDIDVLGEIHEDETVDLDAIQSDSPPEETAEESTTPAEEDKDTEEANVPFHEHPRFKELVEEKNTYKQQFESLQSQIEELKQSKSEPAQPNVPKEFSELYGTDAAEHWEAYKRLNQQTLDNVVTRDDLSEAIKEQMQRIEEEKQQEQQLVEQYQQEYEKRIDSVAKEHGIDKGKFRKWFVENPITKFDANNPEDWDYDIEKGAALFAQINPPKDRGDVSTQTSNAPTESGKYKTLQDLARQSWTNLN